MPGHKPQAAFSKKLNERGKFHMRMRLTASRFVLPLLGCCIASAPSILPAQSAQQPMNYDGNPGGVHFIEEGQPPVMIHPTVEAARAAQQPHGAGKPSATAGNLYYHGGTSDGSAGTVGVETAPKVYVVFWGSQWTNNDPSGEACILAGAAGCPSGVSKDFLGNVGGSLWNATVTQYCQGVSSGSYTCNSGTPVGNSPSMLAGFWFDNATSAPSRPKQSQLAAEAVKAASHFGNTTATSNATTQYVIATAHGNNSSGFGTQYCAWHSSTTSSAGDVAYTNLPYITDAGSSCGANFNGLGPYAGITIVEGHEFAETETDQFPSSGWVDSSGSEIGDKCAWNSLTSSQTLNAGTYPVQPLWSNADNGGSGGCVLSY